MGRVDVVKATFDVKEEGGDSEVKALKEADFMGEGRSRVERGETGEGAGLMGVEEVAGSGQEGEAGSGDTFHNLGEGFQEDDHSEGGWRVVGGFARLVKDYAIGSFEGSGVVPILEQGAYEASEESRA